MEIKQKIMRLQLYKKFFAVFPKITHLMYSSQSLNFKADILRINFFFWWLPESFSPITANATVKRYYSTDCHTSSLSTLPSCAGTHSSDVARGRILPLTDANFQARFPSTAGGELGYARPTFSYSVLTFLSALCLSTTRWDVFLSYHHYTPWHQLTPRHSIRTFLCLSAPHIHGGIFLLYTK